ncbi:MAG TPA: pyridoxamine 5'-phosphate oxidase family protein [Bacteroidia bacterium]|nr:pyridoxamine 5'-phosphate oxidase family protein [Bacteroidia bacterium]
MKPDPSVPPPPAEAFARLGELIKDIHFAMLTTVAADGSLRSRPMGTQEVELEHARIWFFTSIDSPKTEEISREHEVCLAYASPGKQKYVSVSGRATVVRNPDKARKLWTPLAKAWFPGGVEDPTLALLSVRATAAEYWDAHSSKMIQLFGLARTALTGHPADLGENVKVDF